MRLSTLALCVLGSIACASAAPTGTKEAHPKPTTHPFGPSREAAAYVNSNANTAHAAGKGNPDYPFRVRRAQSSIHRLKVWSEMDDDEDIDE